MGKGPSFEARCNSPPCRGWHKCPDSVWSLVTSSRVPDSRCLVILVGDETPRLKLVGTMVLRHQQKNDGKDIDFDMTKTWTWTRIKSKTPASKRSSESFGKSMKTVFWMTPPKSSLGDFTSWPKKTHQCSFPPFLEEKQTSNTHNWKK